MRPFTSLLLWAKPSRILWGPTSLFLKNKVSNLGEEVSSWEPGESRDSRRVLRERRGEAPLRHSPQGPRGRS
jgi:hypothetical protein